MSIQRFETGPRMSQVVVNGNTVGVGTTAWSLCFADLAGVQPHGGWKIVDELLNIWTIKAVRLRTAATRWSIEASGMGRSWSCYDE